MNLPLTHFYVLVRLLGQDYFLSKLRQSDMCLVCIAFASWVLRSSDPDAADTWKAGMETDATLFAPVRMTHCLTNKLFFFFFSSASQRQCAIRHSIPATVREAETFAGQPIICHITSSNIFYMGPTS